jgi:hypothetical protein
MTRARVLFLVALTLPPAGSGCWWMQEDYTQRMTASLATWKQRQALGELLGDAVRVADVNLSYWPPRPTQPVAASSPDFNAEFQGGDPPVEVIILVTTTAGPIQEFANSAIAQLTAAGKGPSEPPQRTDDQQIPSIYGGELTFQLYSAAGQRTLAAAGGAAAAPANPTPYYWYLYFLEEPPQQVMVAFLFPESQYQQFKEAMTTSLKTLAVGSRYGAAQAGAVPQSTTGAAPSGAGAPSSF